MFSWRDFLRSEGESYSQIIAKQAEVAQHGIRADTTWLARRGAFGIVLLPSAEAATALAALSRRVAAEVPAVIYEEQHLHTSLMGTPFEERFLYDPANEEHQDTLALLKSVAGRTCDLFRKAHCRVDYNALLYTPEAVIAKGEAHASFGALLAALHASCTEHNVQQARFGWGSHITINRFAAVRPPDSLHRLFDLLHSAKLCGCTMPSRIAVGYSYWEPTSVGSTVKLGEGEGHFRPHEIFQLGE